jgi:hypothetical protein
MLTIILAVLFVAMCTNAFVFRSPITTSQLSRNSIKAAASSMVLSAVKKDLFSDDLFEDDEEDETPAKVAAPKGELARLSSVWELQSITLALNVPLPYVLFAWRSGRIC